MEEWQKHIKDNHAYHEGKAICGAELGAFEFVFEDVDTAFMAVRGEHRLMPCPACAKTVIDMFSGKAT